MDKLKSFYVGSLSLFLIASCGGGGGGGGSDAPAPVPTPTVTISASPTEVLLSESTTITWSSTNASSCSATGGWTNATTSSGSASVTITSVGSNTFTISCSGAGGSRSASVTVEGYRNTDGVVVDGYISGSSVFIDENDNWTEDTSENSTTSDNEGKFTIKYADGYLVSIGGTDLDSQILLDDYLITHKLQGHSDFKVISPVTSVIAFADSIDMKEALGIDSSIDVSTFDPVANKGDGGINDYLYEKGNQLTVLAYALQNLTNDLNTSSETTQSFFKAIAEEVEKEYTDTNAKVDIESSAFVDKALTNIITAKSLTVSDTTKSNIISALSSVLPVVQIKASDDLTTAVIRFAVSTFQNDIKAIANETASESTITSYKTDILNYIAVDQSIDGDKIAPSITAVSDTASTDEDTSVDINVIANDSYLTSSPLSVTANNGVYGTTSVSNNVVTYAPNTDSCQDDTFTYTIKQGDQTSSASVSITVNCINDSPSIDIASTINVSENETFVAKIGVSDPDGNDNLNLTLGGTDVNSFNLSADYNLSFKVAPDYETKNSYSISLTLTDGTFTVSKNVTIKVLNVNEVAPLITSNAVFSALENQTSIGTVTASDGDGDAITFSISGSEIQITSLGGVLSFVKAPDYETKSSYSATVTASDGLKSSTQNITVNITDIVETGAYAFSGKAIDGYIKGAEVFIDQNYNFKLDSGELFSTTGENGAFNIYTDNESLYTCLQSRPAIANVPVGAIDSTLGEVTQAYKMVLPSVKDTGSSAIIISPFTNILGDAVIQAKANSGIKDEISVTEGCQSTGDSIASRVSNEINQIKTTIENSLSISFNDLLTDFISSSPNSTVSESAAQNIAKFFPYFKTLGDEFDSELSKLHNKTINTDVTIEKASINTILSTPDTDKIPLSFSAIYRTEPNSSGWFIEEKIVSRDAELNRNGEMIQGTCLGTDTSSCSTTEISLEKLKSASDYYFRTSDFINNEYNLNDDNYILRIEDSSRINLDSNAQPKDRTCIYENWLYLTPKFDKPGFTRNDRYNSGFVDSGVSNSCAEILNGQEENIFLRLVDTYEDSTTYESLEFGMTNRYAKSTFLKNKVNNIYANRDNLDIDPLIQEIKSIPRNFKDLNIIRDKLSVTSTDSITLYWVKRNVSNMEYIATAQINIKPNPEEDKFEYRTYKPATQSGAEQESTIEIESTGQTGRNDLFSTITNNSTIFNTTEYIGTTAVTDERTSITGKTIDGYISGAKVFFDVNFNQRLDAGEYNGTTADDGSFDIKINDVDLACIKARPIVADVPVGAVDSTLGEVTEAYQMILPSYNDAGTNKVVISPFTSLLTEAILNGKNASDLDEDLTVTEGCEAAGDAVANNISSNVTNLISSIESTFGVTWADLISDFIETGGTTKVTENVAQKIASFFPYYKEIKDYISAELSSRYGKDVTPNVSLSQDSLNAIFSQGEFTKLPLEFFSVYKTNPNAQGFYNVDEISSSGATVKSNGSLERYLCTLSDSADCLISGLSLNGVANASKNYTRQVNINNDNFSVDGVVGNINIRGRDSRGVRNEDTTPESYCESEETIQFVGPQDSKGLQMEYRYGFGRGVNNLKDCSLLPNYGPTISLRIEKQGRGDNFPNTAPTWAIQFSVNNLGTTRLTESKVYNIIDNDNLNPGALIKEVAQIPAALSKIDDMRKLLSYGEGAFYYYSPNTSVDYDGGETFKTYNYRVSSVPRDDQFQSSEYHPDTGNVDGTILYGQDARDAIFNVMSGSKYDYDNFIGSTAPKSNILFEFEGANGLIFEDRLIDGKNRDYRVFPRLDSSLGWIDATLKGSEISKASMDAFIGGNYTTDTKFRFGLNVDAPFTSTEDFNLKIYSNNNYSTSTEYLELNVELKIETLANGAVQVTWLDGGKVTFKIVEDSTTITKEVINQRGDISRTIPKGSYDFADFDFLKSLLDKVRNKFSSGELQAVKDFFKNNGEYSFKIDLGNYAVLDDYDQTSSTIAGKFGVADNPNNSVYSYYLPIIFGEGTNTDICFNSAWIAEDDISFDIKPIYRNKPGFMTAEEVNFSTTSVTIDKGSQQKCVTFSSPVDDKLKEKQEFIEFEIVNVTGATSGMNILTRLTVQDD